MLNSIVARAEVSSSDGVRVTAGAVPAEAASGSEFIVSEKLKAPFADEIIGEITIHRNSRLIQERAQTTALESATALGGMALLVAVFAGLLIYSLLTRQLKNQAARLHAITPGSDERLEIPPFHRNNELGNLIKDTNSLLDKTEETITSERLLLRRIETLEERYRRIFERAGTGMFLMDDNRRVTLHNPAFLHFAESTGSAEECLRDLLNLFTEPEKVRQMLTELFRCHHAVTADLELTRPDGSEEPLWVQAVFHGSEDVSANEPAVIEGILFDVTARKLAEARTRTQAERDHLTGLYNRLGGAAQLARLEAACGPAEAGPITMFMIDLDGFKFINDTYGHDAGDLILKEVACRFTEELDGAADIIVRWGGDEFVIFVLDVMPVETIFLMGSNILTLLNPPIAIGGGKQGYIGASIGVAAMENGLQEQEELIKHADTAMYRVKRQGKNGVCFKNLETGDYEVRLFTRIKEVDQRRVVG